MGQPPRLSEEQFAILRDVVQNHAPALYPLVEHISAGELIRDDEAGELEKLLVDLTFEEEYEPGKGLTSRGATLDELIGLVLQFGEGFDRR
jgi:hypothetical protein